jgi:hypothetical protein
LNSHFAILDDQERSAASMAVAFLKGRMSRLETLEWALSLTPTDHVKRFAASEVLASAEGRGLKKHFLDAWRLLEESWENDTLSLSEQEQIFRIKAGVRAHDRSGILIDKIKRLVTPRLKVEPRPSHGLRGPGKSALNRVKDLVYLSPTSCDLVDMEALGLEGVNDVEFLSDLTNALESSVQRALSIARRIGWKGDGNLMRLGRLHRVEYTAGSRGIRASDIDEYHSGIAPAVKLLRAVVARLAELDIGHTSLVAHHWRLRPDPIHIRLWASLAKTTNLIGADEIGTWLLSLPDAEFWNFDQFPEVALLRAKSFHRLSSESQSEILRRIRRGPLKSWSPSSPSAFIKSERLQRSLIELRRLEIVGVALPPTSLKWMQANLGSFPHLREMSDVDDGFTRSGHAYWGKAIPDNQYDALSGEDRLTALEFALSDNRGHWDNNPAERAREWMQLEDNLAKILTDFESIPNLIDSFPHVLSTFGWAHQIGLQHMADISDAITQEGQRIIRLLLALGQGAAYQAIGGLSHWLCEWQTVVIDSPYLGTLWEKYWPIAVEATNASAGPAGSLSVSLDETVSSNSAEPEDLDTLNTPAGKLVGVFLRKCRLFPPAPVSPFRASKVLKLMFTSLLAAPGKAGLIARHRLTDELDYFLTAAPKLSKKHLIAPLLKNDAEAIALWRSIARSLHSTRNLKSIGSQIVTRVTDPDLGRESRTSLLTSLAVEALNAELEKREAVIAFSLIQQALRSVEDEVRAEVARVLEDYVQGMSQSNTPTSSHSVENIFRSAIRPFLRTVWPQEHSLATPGSSAAFARLPASVGGAFSEAVDDLHRLLVPFNCWSLHDYGFGFDDRDRLSAIIEDAPQNPTAFLKLLTCTIGDGDDAVIPFDLADALDQLSEVAPGLTSTSEFRRLAALARRR